MVRTKSVVKYGMSKTEGVGLMTIKEREKLRVAQILTQVIGWMVVPLADKCVCVYQKVYRLK